MKEHIDKRALRALTDRQLNDLIGRALAVSGDHTREDLIQWYAADEWRTRHPETIAPAAVERALVAGGFPACYTGPRVTIDLDSGQVVYAAPPSTVIN